METEVNKLEAKAITEFEYMRDLAELKALSNYSLETQLTQEQYEKMMALGRKLNIVNWTI